MSEARIAIKERLTSACLKLDIHLIDGGKDSDGNGFLILPCTHTLEELTNAVRPFLSQPIMDRILAYSTDPNDSWTYDIVLEESEDDDLIISYIFINVPLFEDLESLIIAIDKIPSSPHNGVLN
ncbi:MAG TPA: hypothetical protein VIE65_17380 [Methylobacter sp.]|jgi:hypothetical protein